MVSRAWQGATAAVIHSSSEAACLKVTCLMLLKGQWLFHQGNIFYLYVALQIAQKNTVNVPCVTFHAP